MLALLAHAAAHVPTYTDGGGTTCANNCCTPTHVDLRLSQVLYMHGSGGLEIPLADADSSHPRRADPIGVSGPAGWRVYFDIVFRDKVDATGAAYNFSDFDIYVGCGGCAPTDTPVPASKRTDMAWQKMTIEPFTQTRYYSIFPPDDPEEPDFRSFSSNALLPDVCPQQHVTVHLIDKTARENSNATKVRWGAVLGRAEAFTAEELFLFPDYVLRNHGDAWNERGETIYYSVLLSIALLVVWRGLMMCLRTWPGFSRCCPRYDCLGLTQVIWPCLWSTRARNPGRAKPGYPGERDEECFPRCDRSGGRRVYTREVLYVVAVLAFNTAAIEMLWHLVIAQEADWSTVDRGFYVGIGLVVFSQWLPLLLVWVIHSSILYRDRVRRDYGFADCMPFCDHGVPGERACGQFFCHACYAVAKPARLASGRGVLYCVACWTCSSSPSWWWVELGTAVSLLFWFGSGFFVAPAALALAALVRIAEYGADPVYAPQPEGQVLGGLLSGSVPGAAGGDPVGAELLPLLRGERWPAPAPAQAAAGPPPHLQMLALRPSELQRKSAAPRR